MDAELKVLIVVLICPRPQSAILTSPIVSCFLFMLDCDLSWGSRVVVGVGVKVGMFVILSSMV